jgi:flagellar hook protein FlgE
MFDSILIGMSGMEGFSKGLKVISNNVANLNTPGFKSSSLLFTDAYYQQGAAGDFKADGDGQPTLFGSGLSTLSSVINFQAGDVEQTSNPLDVSISGNGYLVTQDPDGHGLAFTRDGQTKFDNDGNLVSTTTGKYILGYGSDSAQGLTKISLDGLRTSPPKATTTVTFNGNLTTGTAASAGSTPTDPTVTFAVDDALGSAHSLTAVFHNQGTANSSQWTVTISDGTTQVGTGTIGFTGGAPDPTNDKMTFNYTPSGGTSIPITLDFSSNVTSYDTGSLTNLAAASQNGYAAGSISGMTFDTDGKLTITYSNGQTAKGAQLALASFSATDDLQQQGGGEFTAVNAVHTSFGRANTAGLGSIVASQIEESNVDLSGEFSNLIVMQRGYQASSNILSTANDMLQELFDMKGSR